jgi:diguanylate cyclase (GGDEF)-like protein
MRNYKVLAIDDSPEFIETVKAVLTLSDLDVITAYGGREGLEKIYKESPDLVLLDCMMPEMDGYAVVKAMREDPVLYNLPVIMLTGKNGEGDEIKGLSYGIDDYIVKPFNPTVLIARVKAILERKAQSTNANPLTFLAGNVVIRANAEKKMAAGVAFAMMYIDLNQFKSYNDRYGFDRGDEVIKHTASLLIRAVEERGQKEDFIGHIGGDDFIILTSPDHYTPLAERIIALFDETIAGYYDPVDQNRGYIVSIDRSNTIKQFPFMTISVSIISTAQTRIVHYGQLSEIAMELKKVAKKSDKSTFVVDRRKQ